MAEYEIEEITAVGADRHVLVKINWWYNDFARGLRSNPDFVEEGVLSYNMPDDIYEESPLTPGWLLNTAGESVPNYHEVDGEWRMGPDPAHRATLVVKKSGEELLAEFIEEQIAERGNRHKENQPRGHDLFEPEDRPRRNNRPQAYGNKNALKALKGRSGRI